MKKNRIFGALFISAITFAFGIAYAIDPAAALGYAHSFANAGDLGAAGMSVFCLGNTEMQTAIKEALADLTKSVGGRIETLETQIKTYQDQMDEIEKKANRRGLGGTGGGSKEETEEHRKALDLGIRSLINGNQAAADQHFSGVKAMSVGSDVDGGYVVTPTFSTDMTRVMLEYSPFIGLARTIEIEGDAFEEPVDKDDAGAEWVGETQDRGDTDTPELGMFRCPLHEIQAQPKITQKLIDTSRINVVQWLQGKVAEKFAYTETNAFFHGDSIKKPWGILQYPAVEEGDDVRAWGKLEFVKTGVSGGFVANTGSDVLIDLVSRLKTQYLNGATWLMNRFTAASIRKLKNASGDYIWIDGITAGQSATLLGYPVVITDEMPNIGANTMSVAFGNFKKGYTIVRRLGVRFLLDPYTSKPNVKLYTYTRVGGGVNNFEAIKLLKFAA